MSLVSTEMWLSVAAVFAVVLIGVSGYMTIEGWSFFDSLYMTVITLATIGYGETHPLSQGGRAFTLVLIILGAGVLAVVFTAVTQKIVQRQFIQVFNRKKMTDAINRLHDHTIVCGYGRLARISAEELRRSNTPLLIIEKEELRAEEARRNNFLVITGDATSEEVLLQGGLCRAKHMVSLLPKDSDNLYVILTSRELAPNLFILSRAEDDAGEKRLKRAGANKIMAPYRVGGLKIAEGLLRPYVTDFLDLASSSSNFNLQIEEIQIPEESPLCGQSLLQASLRQKTNVIVAAIISHMGDMTFNPSADTIIESQATLIALGKRQELAKLERLVLGEAA